MTIAHGFLMLVIGFVVGAGGGYWLHYRFGARVAADLVQIKQMKP
jgi:hypothetical protein